MNNKKPLTKSDLLVTLKEAGIATKDDVRQIVGEELKSRGVATKDDLKGMATKDDLGKLERSLKRRMGHERNKILETIGKLATHTPTITAFRDLKLKVDKAISN